MACVGRTEMEREHRIEIVGDFEPVWSPCTSVMHSELDCEAAGLPVDLWCGGCLLAKGKAQ